MYRILFSLFLSRLDPETAHHLAFVVIRLLPRLGVGYLLRSVTRPHRSLGVDTLGLHSPRTATSDHDSFVSSMTGR
jgi:dihydroorotate dehydrogenase